MADKMKVPLHNPDGSVSQEVGTFMEIKESKEPWSEYTLEDGTKIRTRQTVVSIVRLDDKKNINGETIYVVQSQNVCNSKNIIRETVMYNFIVNSSFNSFGVIYRSDGAAAVISQNVFENLHFSYFKEKVAPVFTKSIRNLLRIRSHLLLQLDFECGNISEEYFDKEEPKYLSEIEKIPFEKLKEEVKVLFSFTNLPFDSGDISEILNCSVDDAEKALRYYLDEVRSCQPTSRANP